MTTPIAMKRTIPMYKREPAKRPMRYEPTTSKGPMKRILPVKNDAPTKIIKKNVPTNNSGAVVVSKPVLDKNLIKKVPDKNPPTVTETSVKKTPEIMQSKIDVSKTNTTKSETSTSSLIKEVAKSEVKEDGDVDSKDKSPEEYQELSPLLSSALDSELEDIMIKVWQELPDEPISKIEEHVVEKIRNEAGDDLRNVIGLNITKRLLNVQNSLYAKLIFEMRPERGALIDFIKKYNLKTFKRISDESPIFAAQFTNYEDFDRVCKDRVVYCGQVRVNVKACYNYRTCPLNLRTLFSQHDKSTDCDPGEESDVKVKNRASQGNVPKQNKQNVKVQENTRNENKTSTNVSVKTESTNVTKSDTDIVTKIDRMIIQIEKDEEDRIKNEKDEEIKESGTSNSNVQVAQIVTEQKDSEIVDEVDDSQAKLENNQPKMVKTEPRQVEEENKKIDEVDKDEINKLQILNSVVQVTQMDNSKQKEFEVKTEATQDTEENLNLKVKDDDKESKEFNESGIIDDQDVLAFISEGIVLDECSGSEIE